MHTSEENPQEELVFKKHDETNDDETERRDLHQGTKINKTLDESKEFLKMQEGRTSQVHLS